MNHKLRTPHAALQMLWRPATEHTEALQQVCVFQVGVATPKLHSSGQHTCRAELRKRSHFGDVSLSDIVTLWFRVEGVCTAGQSATHLGHVVAAVLAAARAVRGGRKPVPVLAHRERVEQSRLRLLRRSPGSENSGSATRICVASTSGSSSRQMLRVPGPSLATGPHDFH